MFLLLKRPLFVFLAISTLMLSPLSAQIAIRKSEKTAMRKALTWCVLEIHGQFVKVGAHEESDPYIGDTTVTEALPILAIKRGRSDIPAELDGKVGRTAGWSGGSVAMTRRISGAEITGLSQANDLISSQLGEQWEMAEFHDGGTGWYFWAHAEGEFSLGEKFWIYINDQEANPWNLEKSQKAKQRSALKKNKVTANHYYDDASRNANQEILVRAVRDCSRPTVKQCIKTGADVNLPIHNENGTTLLMLATDVFCQRYLLLGGADKEAQDHDGRTALFYKLKLDGFILTELLEAGADVNHTDKLGQTPVYWAIRYNKTGFLEKLIKFGADLTVVDARNLSLLQYAAELDRGKCIRIIAREQPKDIGRMLNEALISAAKSGHISSVKVLLDLGADRNFTDSNQKNALFYARENNHPKVMAVLNGQ